MVFDHLFGKAFLLVNGKPFAFAKILLINAFSPFGGFEGLEKNRAFSTVGTQNTSHSKQVICLLKVVTCFDNSTHCRD